MALPARAEGHIRITAELEHINYGLAGTNEQRLGFPVTCIVSANDWWIEAEYPPKGRQTCYFDGTNVYRRLQGPAKGSRQKGDGTDLQTGASDEPFATIVITPSPGGLCLGNLGVNIPWLAFCSGSYLKREGRVIAVPVNDICGMPDSFACRDKTQIFDDAVGLPQRVELFTSKTQYFASLADRRLYRNKTFQRVRDSLPSVTLPPDGILRFRYIVNSSTNFNGWTLPTEFSFTAYLPGLDGSATRFVGGTGRVTSINVADKPQNVFSSAVKQTVLDGRFRHETKVLDAIGYAWPGSNVPPVTDPRLQANYRETLKGVNADLAASRSWVRSLFRGALLFSPALFAGLYYVFGRRHKYRTSNTPSK